jgi:hypothetical protein
MTLTVPAPVAAYLAAEQAKDAEQLSLCFTKDGLVRDEGRDYRGRDAIVKWEKTADATYRSMQPPQRSNERRRGDCASALTGDFPGSPVEVNHFFQLSKGKIASLEIR